MDDKRTYDTKNKPCLVRCGSFEDYKMISLHKRVEIVIGRNPSADFCIASPVISRIHAVIKRERSQWTITDQKSMNGVYANGKKILPMEPFVLQDRMKISFGMKEDESDFTYVFYGKDSEFETTKKRAKLCSEVEVEPSRSLPVSTHKLRSVIEEKCELENELKEMKKSLEEKTAIETELREELRVERMKNQIISHDMEEQSKNLKDAIETADKKNVVDEYSKYISQLEKDLQTIVAGISSVEEQLNQTSAGSNSKCQELLVEKQHLQNMLATKKLKQRLLQEKVNALSLQEKCQNKKLYDVSVITELMEMELQCSICSELFVEATTLNCSHSFCKKCITDWLRKSTKHSTCPICRRKVKTQTHSSVLDSFIDKMVETFSTEMRERRMELVKQRKKLAAAR